ncbi:Rieske 2Fe-2S domain-containing protein [Conyzicola sp.]|uniref:Rieske 2Fe-2S domain-containing protein n=1 Tax=Conyzicola sp. TaxID=1969404 RepID=UPI003988D940
MRELGIVKKIAVLEDAEVLDPVVNRVRDIVNAVVRPRGLRDLLHGVPVGHAVHPVAVMLPIGAWVSSAILDCVPGSEKASRLLVGAGVAGVLPSVATGLTDWSELHEQQQRVGLVHAASNTVATAFYAASFVQRTRGRHASGRVLGLAGLAFVGFSGYLGGHLAYRQAAAVNHAEDVPHRFPTGWRHLGALEEFAHNELTQRTVDGVPLLVVRSGAGVDVLANTCSHLSGPLDEGELVVDGGERCVVCPWHKSVFSLSTGDVVHGPATAPQPKFESRVTDGSIEVMLEGAG